MATNQIPQDNMNTSGQTTTTATQGEFGTSEFGERLDYGKPKYQDLWAFILFYVHVAIIVGLCVYFWGVTIPELEDEASNSDTTGTVNTDDEDESDGSDTTGLWLALVASLFAGALFGVCSFFCFLVNYYTQNIFR